LEKITFKILETFFVEPRLYVKDGKDFRKAAVKNIRTNSRRVIGGWIWFKQSSDMKHHGYVVSISALLFLAGPTNSCVPEYLRSSVGLLNPDPFPIFPSPKNIFSKRLTAFRGGSK
jgi:hypothetical protein